MEKLNKLPEVVFPDSYDYERKYVRLDIEDTDTGEQKSFVRISDQPAYDSRHKRIVESFIEELLSIFGQNHPLKFVRIGGGRIKKEKGKFVLWHHSSDYGKEKDRELTAKIIENNIGTPTEVQKELW